MSKNTNQLDCIKPTSNSSENQEDINKMHSIQKEAIVLVDVYETGLFLAHTLKGYGYPCIHITSNPETKDVNREDIKKICLKDILYKGNIDAVIESLLPFRIKFVISASENGVELAELLAERLGTPFQNKKHLRTARRNKYFMHKSLSEANVRSIPQFLSSNLKDILKWIHKTVNYPVVVKPVSSAAGEGVSFCDNDEMVKDAFHKIIHNNNIFGQKNTDVLVQKRMYGIEYVVNTVSYENNHFITDIWISHKKEINGEYAYDYQCLISPSDDIYPVLTSYIKDVLPALGIHHGAGHSEIILTSDGPVLVETGARLSGAFNPSITEEALGYNQISMLVASYLNPDILLKCSATRNLKKQARIVSMIAPTSGKITLAFSPSDFFKLKTFHCLQHRLDVGHHLNKTTNITNCPGNIYLVANKKEDLEKDYIAIREMEQTSYAKMFQ